MRWVSAGLASTHRVLGVVVGLFVLLWFGSGAVLLVVPYPNLTETERFSWLEPLRVDHCCVSLELALKQVELTRGVERIRLVMAGGRPVYVINFLDGTLATLWADRGEPMSGIGHSDAVRIAQQHVPFGGEIAAEALQDDQWTVQQRFDPHRPLWKVLVHDADGREIYVSSATGEIVMDTTAFERRWNWIGAVLHWLYLPSLRRHWAVWDQTVWWLAATGVVTAATGLALGIQHLRCRRGQGHSRPFSGIKRWHHLFGVAIGAVVCAWLFSGMLSMDHGRWFSMPEPTVEQRLRFMGGPLMPRDLLVPLGDALWQAQLGGAVKEIMITKVGGVSYYVFRSDSVHQVVVSAARMQSPLEEFSLSALTQAASAVFPVHKIESSEIAQGDTYYYSTVHNPRPLPALRVVVDDSAQTWLHIDMQTGQLMELMDHSRRVYRWLFHGLHSWDAPFLLEYDRSRKLLLLIFCFAGFVFSMSGLYLGIKLLVAQVQEFLPPLDRLRSPDEGEQGGIRP